MSSAALSIYVISFYEIILGIGFLCIPNKLFPIFKIPTTSEPWIKVVGAMALLVGYYNYTISTEEIEALFLPCTYARIGFALIMVYLINIEKAPKALYLFALVDVIAAGWTYWTL